MKPILKNKFFKLLFSFLITLFFCFNAQTSSAKEYYYQDFEVNITINQDSTFDVIEKQTYYLDGSFGFFTRDVVMKDIDAVTDIEVFDEDNNRIPKSELDINSISGAKHIQWNFARRDFLKEEKGWTVKYKVHGGISFLKNYDEIYWNAVPSVRDVAIQNVKITVSLPNNEKFRNDLIQLYAEGFMNPLKEYSGDKDYFYTVTSVSGYYFNEDNTEAIFWGKNIKPNTNFTIAAGFPKGIVSQSAYFKDFLSMYYGFILSILIFIIAVIYGFYHWHKTEKSREGKRAIIPQYEPPQNLKPAMAEVIIKEKLTDKGLAATIIDLAVRGYVRIEEEESELKSNLRIVRTLKKGILPLLLILFLNTVVLILSDNIKISDISIPYDLFYLILLVAGIMLVVIFSVTLVIPLKSKSPDYIVRKIKSYENSSDLEDYEKEYLQALFGSGDHFSTKELKKSQTKSRELYEKIKKVKDKIYEETELDTKAFEVGVSEEKKKAGIWIGIAVIVYFISFAVGDAGIEIGQPLFLAATAILSAAGLYAFIKYEARLSDSGIKLKEDWLGFKMYLETAEKYRMQNLKPEYFEKYLPYAMIFGIEKKWAKAFEMMNIPQPTWYGGNAVVAGHIGAANMASSFSPSAFSASFASSFSSAFASSGASGASGGGGGAGGGGGGGGGGAG